VVKKAIDLDPNYAEAYASLGWLDMQFAWNQWSGNPLADLKDASELAQKALALDDTNSSALTLLSESDWMHWRYDQAVADGERAVAINPNYAQGYHSLSHTLLIYGKPEAAISAAQKAMRLDPTGRDLYLLDVGVAYVNMGAMGAGRFINHFMRASPDYVLAVPPNGRCHSFVVSAALLVVTETIGTVMGVAAIKRSQSLRTTEVVSPRSEHGDRTSAGSVHCTPT
jgi:tetratricopeptide (TPR) repeat protein